MRVCFLASRISTIKSGALSLKSGVLSPGSLGSVGSGCVSSLGPTSRGRRIWKNRGWGDRDRGVVWVWSPGKPLPYHCSFCASVSSTVKRGSGQAVPCRVWRGLNPVFCVRSARRQHQISPRETDPSNLSDAGLGLGSRMEFLTPPRPPPGPPAMDLEEPGGSLSPSQDAPRDLQWAPAPGGPGSLSHMELDGPSVEDLVQQFETLPGDLGGLSPDGPPCPLHIATGHGLAPQDVADAHGLLSAEAGRDDLLSLLRLEEAVPSPSYPEEPPDPAPHLLQPPEDPEEESGPPEWAEGASAEQGGSRSSSSSPESWLETVPLVAPAGPPTGAQVQPARPRAPLLLAEPGTQAALFVSLQSPATPASPASRPALQEGEYPARPGPGGGGGSEQPTRAPGSAPELCPSGVASR